ncbi:MAG: DMT family transporter, partial [Arenicellales bacterium]
MSGEHRKGFWLTLGGVLAFTPDSLLIRLTAVDSFTLAFGRGILGGTVILLGFALYARSEFFGAVRSLGRWGALVCVLQVACTITFYAAFSYTSVANVLVIFACTPLIAALLSKMIFDEGISSDTRWAIVGAALGLIVVASGSLDSIQWFGDSLALLNAVMLALLYTILRGHREINMVPAAGIGLLLTAVVALMFAKFPVMDSVQWASLILAGLVVLPLALVLMTLGPRYLPAPEVAMISLLEAVLGPLWVWWVIGENPGWRTIVGGSVVIAVLMVHSAVRLRSENHQ